MKSRTMRWAGHLEGMGRRQDKTGFCLGNLKEYYYMEDIVVDGRLMLKWVLSK
jgi:hypothetical protein